MHGYHYTCFSAIGDHPEQCPGRNISNEFFLLHKIKICLLNLINFVFVAKVADNSSFL